MALRRWRGELAVALKRWWSRLAGVPARALMAALSSRVPNRVHDGIRLVVADARLEASAERFFDRTVEALTRAAAEAPLAYAALRQDVRQVVLSGQADVPYQRFQLAVVVPPRVAFWADPTTEYPAWLLHSSAHLHGEGEARARSDEFLGSLAPDPRVRVTTWLEESSIAWKEV